MNQLAALAFTAITTVAVSGLVGLVALAVTGRWTREERKRRDYPESEWRNAGEVVKGSELAKVLRYRAGGEK